MTGSFGVGVLASGNGTNLQAILDRVHGREGIEVVGVGSEKRCRAIERAQAAEVEVGIFPRREHGGDRVARDAAMAGWLRERGAELVVLAGYMQLVSPEFLAAFPQRVINVHPTLLPAFPGMGSVEEAIAYGVRVAGVTVHFVDEGVDSGAIIAQRAIDLPPDPDPDHVRDLLRPLEHDLLTDAVRLIAAGRVQVDPERPRIVHIGGP